MSAKDRVHRLRPPKASPEGGALQVVRQPSPREQGPDPHAEMARAPAGGLRALRRREPAAAAWARLAAPLRRKEGIRVGALGISGAGKTTGLVDFVASLQTERLIDVTLIYDIKLPIPQYPGQVSHDANDITNSPPERYPAAMVLRRKDLDHEPSLEDAARVTLHASYHGVPTLLLVDEFARALSPSGREFTAPSVRRLLSEGRALGASLLWTTQLPQRTPTEAFDQSQILLFRCGAKALAYLIDQRVIDEKTAAVVAALERGQFVLVASDEDFDGIVYEVPPPRSPAPAPALQEAA